MSGEDPTPYRHQVAEVPPVAVEVTEYRLHTLTCAKCGAATRAELPERVAQGGFGSRLQATVALLSGRYHLSKRDTSGLMNDFFGVDLSLGSVPTLEQRTSEVIAQAVEAARSYVQAQGAVHQDETGWKEGIKKAWLWVAATSQVTVFRVDLHRSADVAKRMLGLDFKGVLNTDRWSAYNWLDNHQRQLCWSHLLRDFQAFVERGGESQALGEALLVQVNQMFIGWHAVKNGTSSRAQFQEQMRPMRIEVGRIVAKRHNLLSYGHDWHLPKHSQTGRGPMDLCRRSRR